MRSTVRWEQRSNRAASAVEILSLVKVLCKALRMCRLYDSYDILSRSKNNFHTFGCCEASCKDGTPAGGARVLRVRHEQDLTYRLSNLFLLDEKTASRVTFGQIPVFQPISPRGDSPLPSAQGQVSRTPASASWPRHPPRHPPRRRGRRYTPADAQTQIKSKPLSVGRWHRVRSWTPLRSSGRYANSPFPHSSAIAHTMPKRSKSLASGGTEGERTPPPPTRSKKIRATQVQERTGGVLPPHPPLGAHPQTPFGSCGRGYTSAFPQIQLLLLTASATLLRGREYTSASHKRHSSLFYNPRRSKP